MFGNQEIAEAHAVITDAHHWVNNHSPLRHEFLVIDAKMAGCTFWVKIDRSRTGKGKPTMRWDALDTVSVFFFFFLGGGVMRTHSDFLHSR